MISLFKRQRWTQRFYFAPVLIFALIVAGAVWLRLRLLSEGIVADEGLTYFDITAPSLRGMIEHIRVSEAHPPLFFLLVRGWAHLFGFGATALKSFSFFWSMAAVIATYALARRCASRPVALGALFLMAICYQAIAYSNNLRPYPMMECLTTVCILLYERVLFGGKLRTSAAWIIVAIAMIWTHYLGIVVLAVSLLSTLVVRRHIVVRPWVLISGYALIAASFLPWLPIALVHLHSGTPWIPVSTASDRIGVVFGAIGWYSPFAPWLRLWFGVHPGNAIATILLLVAAVAAYGTMRSPSRDRSLDRVRQERSFAFVVLMLSIVLSVLALAGFSFDRYFVPFAPLVCVLYAGLLGRIFEGMSARGYPVRALRYCLGGLVIATACLAIATSVKYTRIPKTGFPALVEAAAPLFADSNVLWIVAPDFAASSFGYYLREKHVTLHGFAQWDDPQFPRIPEYAAIWDDPYLLEITLARINADACGGFTRLAFVRPVNLGPNPFTDLGTVAFSRERTLELALKQRYPIIEMHSYTGYFHSASLVLLRLRCGG
ncbi:MAG TPA: glycosyltransferase family 39 protein [Candidatus Baltobacteraceae bacterium]|jgi:4-amino-4-deoxy-L-arabinose transferase-like glycosyltransferase|nr:glycosyltransferase family 39 protein [Candidatus Baltobacteraceae bacterium]